MRYVVTGGAGYIGSRLCERLSGQPETERIVVCDLRPPSTYRPKVGFERLDVRDAGATRSLLERLRPDALVHLAFILNPIHDEHAMYDIDVNGTQNVLEGASAAGNQQVLVTSSASAYGAFPDNPVPIEEDHPVRGVPDFSYARDKTECDRLCQLWALRHPQHTMTIVRPCIVFGPSVDNYLVRFWTNQPFQADVGNLDVPIQFVHEDDLVEVLVGLLEGRHGGAFNVAGEGTMTLGECAELVGTPTRRMPLWAAGRLARLMWRLRLSEAPPGQLHFARHPWVVSNEKLKATLGWSPRYSTREAFELTMRTHGKLPPAPPAGGPIERVAQAATPGPGAA
jgi:UDP-glucose 4-epimerase